MEIRFAFNDDLTPAIQRALAAARDFTPAMENIAALMEGEVLRRFEAGESPDGTPWKPSKRAIKDGGKTLIDTRRLLSSMTRDHDATSAVVGTNVAYARPLQEGVDGIFAVKGHSRTVSSLFGKVLGQPTKFHFGAHGRDVTMPARPFLGFGETELREIPEIIADHLRTAFAGGQP